MGNLWNKLIHGVGHMNTTGWVLVFCAVVVVCALCLRGHSSHSNY